MSERLSDEREALIETFRRVLSPTREKLADAVLAAGFVGPDHLAAVTAERDRMREGLERVATALEAVGGPCTGPGCPGCTAGRLRALLPDAEPVTEGGGDDG